jgi:signal transduction histidine kinase
MALLELNRELSVRFDSRQVVDLVLFNLMGHLGTRQAALWLTSRSEEATLDLIRGHGVAAGAAAAVTAAIRSSLGRWPAGSHGPVRIGDGGVPVDRDGTAALRAAGFDVVGPLHAHGQIIGFVALGRRADGEGASALDLEVVRSSLGMAGVAIENSRLYHELEARNRSLAEAYRDLMELDQMKTEFVQNVNHELRTPLAVIAGAVECLLDPPDPDARRQNLLAAISAQAVKLGDMVQSLLDLSSLSGDDAARRVETVDLRAFIERYIFERSARMADSGRTLAIADSAPALSVAVIPGRLIKALDLLLDNAIKFTPEGSHITLAGAMADDPAYACLRFADDGPGFPPDQVERAFRPFHQADGSATRAAGGLGIGLAVARRLLESMQADISIESGDGVGTEFRMRLRRS